MEIIPILLLILLSAVIILSVVTLIAIYRRTDAIITLQENTLQQELSMLRLELSGNFSGQFNQMQQSMHQQLQQAYLAQGEQSKQQQEAIRNLTQTLRESLDSVQNTISRMMNDSRSADADRDAQLQQSVQAQMQLISDRLSQLEAINSEKLELIRTTLSGELSEERKQLDGIRGSVETSLKDLREHNEKKLNEIRITVDEKLQSTLEKRIGESFRTVSEQLEKVYTGIGEMKSIASDVGGLKKVLSGVKTRGILGEMQLGAILEEILSPGQYETNIVTAENSRDPVEYAVKLPGMDGGTVYLPIDAKFPGERYQQLLDAQESGEKAKIELAYRELDSVIRREAKDIASKYISVPRTTNFAIMFLPFEGLYAEIVSRGLLEVLQREYHVNVAGPSTMAALLNSLQMGFKTLAIQKRSNEVWQVLNNVKSEFDKFGGVLEKMQKHLKNTTEDLDDLLGTRTRAMQRKLEGVQVLESHDKPAISLIEE